VRALQDRLSGTHAFHETLSYSFLPQELGAKLGVLGEPFVEAVNPVSEGWQRVRRSVATSLLGLVEPNLRHASELCVFEVGKAYFPERANAHGEPLELHELALVLAQPKPAHDARYDAPALQRLKAVVEDVLREVGRPAASWLASADGVPPWVHPKRCAVARLEHAGTTTIVASLAELNPQAARALGVSADVAIASVWIDALVAAPRTPRHYEPLPKFPGTLVDVALSVPSALEAARVEQAIRGAGKDLVHALRLFDFYQGERAGAGRKSLAYTVELVADGRTLAEKDTQRFLERLAREAEALGGELRRA
jgi:phenylalanyl-tRNA synthetase beta chain